jgi:hypothetical protein
MNSVPTYMSARNAGMVMAGDALADVPGRSSPLLFGTWTRTSTVRVSGATTVSTQF